MTLVITMKEDLIEDLSDEWRVELKYDETDDNDERDEIQQEIEKKQQSEREKYILSEIAPIIKYIDIIYNCNKLMMQKIDVERVGDDNKMDVDSSGYLELRLFANDGLNEA